MGYTCIGNLCGTPLGKDSWNRKPLSSMMVVKKKGGKIKFSAFVSSGLSVSFPLSLFLEFQPLFSILLSGKFRFPTISYFLVERSKFGEASLSILQHV